MMADSKSRRKGLAFEALTLFMAYAVKNLVGLLSVVLLPHSNLQAKYDINALSITSLFNVGWCHSGVA